MARGAYFFTVRNAYPFTAKGVHNFIQPEMQVRKSRMKGDNHDDHSLNGDDEKAIVEMTKKLSSNKGKAIATSSSFYRGSLN